MWPFKRKKSKVALAEAIRYLRADDWKRARQAFQTLENSNKSLSSLQRVQVFLGSAICHLSHGNNTEAKKLVAQAKPLTVSGTNAAKFVEVLEKACLQDLFSSDTLVPPIGGADFTLSNMVPVEVSFLKHSFLQLVVDS